MSTIAPGDLIEQELQDRLEAPRPDSTEIKTTALSWLDDMAMNTMEICRACNGRDPYTFKGCYGSFTFDTKERCNSRKRGCNVPSGTIDTMMRSLEKKGQVQSLKIRWFDGRDPGAAKTSIQLDNFRLYYRTKESLARRLIQDININLGEADYR